MKKPKIKKDTIDKLKFVVGKSFPDSKFFYFLFALNLVNIGVSLSSGKYEIAVWMILATLWMWGFYIYRDMASEMHNMVHELIDINKENFKEMEKLLKHLKMADIVQKGSPTRLKN